MKTTSIDELELVLSEQAGSVGDLRLAIVLAEYLGIPIKGLYIEDDNLKSAAELTVSREITYAFGEEKKFSLSSVIHSLQIHARQREQQLHELAKEKNIMSLFEVISAERVSWIAEQLFSKKLLILESSRTHCVDYNEFSYAGALKKPVKLLYVNTVSSEFTLKLAFKIASLNNAPLIITKTVQAKSLQDDSFENTLKQISKKFPQVNVQIEKISQNHFFTHLFSESLQCLVISVNSDLTTFEPNELVKFVGKNNYPVIFIH